MTTIHAEANRMTEWSFSSTSRYADPFNDVELDVVFTDPEGHARQVPAFWGGENIWRVRYASPTTGVHRFRTECSDKSNEGLHGRQGQLEVSPYEGDNPLHRHGPLRVSGNGRHLEHIDGTPFFWLADTWWMGLCRRLEWPTGFQTLLADRMQKGFTVVQIVAGLYPDMPAFDERGANEAGFPWDEEFTAINPGYFDMADLRLGRLVSSGIVPCIVGCWGYFIKWMGIEKMKKHWRHLVARYGAYPVVWVLAGEGMMPYYLSDTKEADAEFQKRAWAEVGRYLQETDPYNHPATIHCGGTTPARETVEDDSVLDFNILQTGHGDRTSIPNTVKLVTSGYTAEPTMPVINSEVCYDGIGGCCAEQVQRFMFWCCILSGAAGHTYGANGIWQVNTRGKPYGPSPHGTSWGDTPWEDAYQLPGSSQLGLAKRLLEKYDWWRFEPHPNWVEPHWSEANYEAPYAAGIPGEVRVIFMPFFTRAPTVTGLEKDVRFRAYLFNPIDGTEEDLGTAEAGDDGAWTVPFPPPLHWPPIYQDWVLVLERS